MIVIPPKEHSASHASLHAIAMPDSPCGLQDMRSILKRTVAALPPSLPTGNIEAKSLANAVMRASSLYGVFLQIQGSFSSHQKFCLERGICCSCLKDVFGYEEDATSPKDKRICFTMEKRCMECLKAGELKLSTCLPDPHPELSAAIHSIMATYAKSQRNDWQQFAIFNELHYVRHLVDKNEEFELMLVCWRRGQRSSIHNHDRSHCWLAVLQGELEEVQYCLDDTARDQTKGVVDEGSKIGDASGQEICPVRAKGHSRLKVGGMSYIRDALGLHTIGCPSECETDAVSLHLYAPPITRVKLYDADSGHVTSRTPGYFTVGGNKS